MTTVIVNSDDFGISTSVNAAIVASFEQGLISSTTLMANMPGFEEAAAYGCDHPRVKGRLGVHVNLTQGVPLTEAMRRCRRFCTADGVMSYVRRKPIFAFSADEKRTVLGEIRAQVERLRQHGVFPTHLDGHQHIHTELAIAPLCVRVCREFGIPAIRLTKNVGRSGLPRMVYKRVLNGYFSAVVPHTTTYFCGADDFRQLMAEKAVSPTAAYEVMVHSRYDAAGELVDLDGSSLSQKMRPIVEAFPPVSFANLGKTKTPAESAA